MQALMGMLVLLILDPMGEGHLVPALEFTAARPDACADFHYHAAFGGSVTALDGTVIVDPAPSVCGYGTVEELPSFTVFDAGVAADADFDGIPDLDETALGLDPGDPDSDGDGTPDGEEDTDADLLTNQRELYEFQTDPTDSDTDGDGRIDGVSVALRWHERTFTFAPTLAGSFRNTGIDVPQMQETLSRANGLALSLHYRFVPIGFATELDAGDANMDGSLTAGELRASQTHFNDLFDTVGENGVYVGFGGEDFLADLGGPEGTVQEGNPTIFLEWKPTLGLDLAFDRAANATVHELFHFEGGEHPAPGTPEDVPENVLQPLEDRAPFIDLNGLGQVLFPESELFKTQALKTFRFTGRVFDHHEGTTTRWRQQLGRSTDEHGDASGGDLFDLDQAFLSSREDEDLATLAVTLAYMPMMGDRIAVRTLWDTDDDPNTGLTGPEGAVGIEKEILLLLEYGLSGFTTWSTVTDNTTFDTTPGPTPRAFELRYRFGHGTGPVPAATGLVLEISKEALGLTASEVPVYVQTEPVDTPLNANDATSLVFDLEAWQKDPVLTASAAGAGGGAAASAPGPGDSLELEASGLTPSSELRVEVDETQVLLDATDGAGAFSGSVTLPAGLPGGPHFVTAQDATGLFAGTIVTTVPEPAGGLGALAALGALGLGARRAARAGGALG